MKILKLTAVVGSIVGLLARDAQAQAWLKDRRYQEGAGIRTGDFELHPGVGGEVGYDSNWFGRTSESGNFINGAPTAPVKDVAVLRLTPSLSLSTLSGERVDGQPTPQTVAFRANLSATGRYFIGSEEFSNQHNISVNADLRLDILPTRPWSFVLTGGYIRSIRPNVLADPNASFNTSNPYVGGELVWTPNNGTFDAGLGYRFNAALFEQQGGAPFSNLNHDFSFRTRWRFRPRTALFHTTRVGIIDYQSPERAINVLTDSTPVRSSIGLNGLITPRFGGTISAGYGGSFYERGQASTQQYDSLIAQVEARFYLTAPPETIDPNQVSLSQSTLALGYIRDFENSYLGDFNDVNKGYAALSYFFGGKFLLSLNGAVAAIRYPDIYVRSGAVGATTPGTLQRVADGFTVIRPEAQLFGEYRITNSVGLNATLTYLQNISDARIPFGTALYHMSSSRFTAFGGVRWFL
jgi:hypothetical protein